MSNLLHAYFRDPTNSGYVSDSFICPSCLCQTIRKCPWLILERLAIVTPVYLSRLSYPPISEPQCAECSVLFQRYE